MATKNEFLENAFIYNSISAAVQRNRVYSKSDNQEVRGAIRQVFRQKLSDVIKPFLLGSQVEPPLMSSYAATWSPAEAAQLPRTWRQISKRK